MVCGRYPTVTLALRLYLKYLPHTIPIPYVSRNIPIITSDVRSIFRIQKFIKAKSFCKIFHKFFFVVERAPTF